MRLRHLLLLALPVLGSWMHKGDDDDDDDDTAALAAAVGWPSLRCGRTCPEAP